MIWWGSKWPYFGVGGEALFAPPMSALGGRLEYLGHGTEPDQRRICRGDRGGCHPPGEILYYRAPPWDVGTPPGIFFGQNQKKEAKLSKISNFSVTFSKTVPSAPLYNSFG